MASNEKMWAILVHMGNWGGGGSEEMNYDELLFDEEMWEYIINEAPKSGINTIILDICAGIAFAKHPEITLKGAWTRAKLRRELAKCRERGLKVIPKLNFATTHSKWLGKYKYMISSEEYYKVCDDLIKEAYELFDHPEYIHLGMDEEDAAHVKHNDYAVFRQGKLYWHDVSFLVDSVRDTGAKAWMWSCPLFDHPEEYKKHIDADDAILSPWYYNAIRKENWTPISSRDAYVAYYNSGEYKAMNLTYVEEDPFLVNFRNVALPLMENGYKYMPCASICNKCDINAEEIMRYFKDNAPDEQILGYVMAWWKPTVLAHKEEITKALRLMKEAKEKIYK